MVPEKLSNIFIMFIFYLKPFDCHFDRNHKTSCVTNRLFMINWTSKMSNSYRLIVIYIELTITCVHCVGSVSSSLIWLHLKTLVTRLPGGNSGLKPCCDGGYAPLMNSKGWKTGVWSFPNVRLTGWAEVCAWKLESEGQSAKIGN